VFEQLNSDETCNRRNLSMSASEQAPSLYEQAMKTSRTPLSLPCTFPETFARLMDIGNIRLEQLAEETMMLERSTTRYCNEERSKYSADAVAILCVGMHLDPLFSFDLLQKAGILLKNTPGRPGA